MTDNRFVAERDWVQTAGAVEVMLSVTVPLNPLARTTAIWEVPAVLAVVVIEAGVAVKEKSCIVTGTSTNATVDPLVPVTLTVKVPPEGQVTERVAVCAGGRTTLAAIVTVQVVGAPVVVRSTVPEKLPVGVTVITELPAVPATVVIEIGFAVRVMPAGGVTMTGTPTVLIKVPLVPWTVTVKLLVPEQVTDRRLVAERVTVQPVGAVEIMAVVTVPVKPLMRVTPIWEVPAVLVVVVIEEGVAVKAKSWTVTRTPTVLVIEPLVP